MYFVINRLIIVCGHLDFFTAMLLCSINFLLKKVETGYCVLLDAKEIDMKTAYHIKKGFKFFYLSLK